MTDRAPTIAAIRKLARSKGYDFAAHEERGSPLGTKLSACIFERFQVTPLGLDMPLIEFQVWGSTRAIRNRRAMHVVKKLEPRALHLEET